MTEIEKEKYERNLKIYRHAMANPYLTYEEVGSIFGLEKTSTGQIIRKMHKHLTSGEPFYKSRAPKSRPKRGNYKPSLVNQGLNPRVKNPDAMWEKAYREGRL